MSEMMEDLKSDGINVSLHVQDGDASAKKGVKVGLII